MVFSALQNQGTDSSGYPSTSLAHLSDVLDVKTATAQNDYFLYASISGGVTEYKFKANAGTTRFQDLTDIGGPLDATFNGKVFTVLDGAPATKTFTWTTVSAGTVTGTGGGTTNRLARWTGANNIADSAVLDTSGALSGITTLTTTGLITGVGLTTTGAITATGQTLACGAITSTGALALGSNTITCGAITCTTIQTNGNTVNCGTINCANISGSYATLTTPSSIIGNSSTTMLILDQTGNAGPTLDVQNQGISQLKVTNNTLTLGGNAAYSIERPAHLSTAGTTLTIKGQNAGGTNQDGGDIVLTGGIKTGTGKDGVILVPDGVPSKPGISFSADPDTGIYRDGANSINFATAASAAFSVNGSQNLTFWGTSFNATNGTMNLQTSSTTQLAITANTLTLGGDAAYTVTRPTNTAGAGATLTLSGQNALTHASISYAGGAITLKAGTSNPGAGGGTGGALNLYGGDHSGTNAGAGGAVNIKGGTVGSGSNRVGGAINIDGGASDGVGVGGAVNITTGTSSTNVSGTFTLTCPGTRGTTLTMTGGTGSPPHAGNLTFTGGTPSTDANGSSFTITPTAKNGTGTDGNCNITGTTTSSLFVVKQSGTGGKLVDFQNASASVFKFEDSDTSTSGLSLAASRPIRFAAGTAPTTTTDALYVPTSGQLWFNGAQIATGGVTGAGTNNYLVKYTSTGSTIGDSQLLTGTNTLTLGTATANYALQRPDTTSGTGWALNITGSTSLGGAGAGGDISITPGTGAASAAGGTLGLYGGVAGSGGSAGPIYMRTGGAGGLWNMLLQDNKCTVGDNDAYTLQRRNHGSGAGTDFNIQGQNATGTNQNGGNIVFIGGTATGTGAEGTVLFPNGSAARPSISFGSDNDVGMYRSAANTLNFAVNGANTLQIDPSRIQLQQAVTFQFLAYPPVGATTDALSCPTTAQLSWNGVPIVDFRRITFIDRFNLLPATSLTLGNDENFLLTGTGASVSYGTGADGLEGSMRLLTGTGDNNQSSLEPRSGSITNAVCWRTDTECEFAIGIGTNAITDIAIMAGLKLTNSMSTTGDSDAAFFLFNTDDLDTKWRNIKAGNGAQDNSDNTPTVAQNTHYNLRLSLQSDRSVKYYINNVLTFTSSALNDNIALYPFVAVKTLTTAERRIYIDYVFLSRPGARMIS